MHNPSTAAPLQRLPPEAAAPGLFLPTVILTPSALFINLRPFISSTILHLPSSISLHCRGAGTESTIPFSTSSIDCPPIATSGASCTRCRSTGSEAALMSSGITK